jgi:hypothetical protein
MIRRYSKLVQLKTLEERFEYLRLDGVVGAETFGFDRYLNQRLYRSPRWRSARETVIARDMANELGIEGMEIYDQVVIHHMNPLLIRDVEIDDPKIYNPEFLICVSPRMHRAIHYGDESLLPKPLVVRTKNDTCPWKV